MIQFKPGDKILNTGACNICAVHIPKGIYTFEQWHETYSDFFYIEGHNHEVCTMGWELLDSPSKTEPKTEQDYIKWLAGNR